MWANWVLVVEAIAIVTTNIITIVTFTRSPRLRMRKYSLIVNLAVADLLVGLVALPTYIHPIPQGMEKVRLVLDAFLGIASLLGLAAIAIGRTYATFYPFKHRAISKTPYIIGIAVVWLVALLFGLNIGHVFRRQAISTALIVLAGISIPLVIVITAYFLIWVKFTCMRNVLGNAIHQRNKKLSVTLAIVTIISLIAWVPFLGMSLYYSFCVRPCARIKSFIVNILKVLQYGNSLVNFIIYSLRMPDFRAGMAQVLRINRQIALNAAQRENIELQNNAQGHVN